MKIIDTGFEGLVLLEPRFFKDGRGCFYESWRHEDYKKIGITENFLQDNVSVSMQHALRGLHYQKDQGQLVTVTHGKIFDVVVDIRPDSKTYKRYFSIQLDGNIPMQLYMPQGFAHGFCVLSDMAVINYKCTQYYDPSKEGGILWSDPEIGIQWPEGQKIISEKDQLFSTLGAL
ncbi:MAG: dTDP-4-dehydrorhamnose 3,5-epimerase [Alphaproteobacteria bacterium]|nr:dTDP-4-dehydrorhamnose 3,5-epimerase [Alphaproteobacteria bacterium]